MSLREYSALMKEAGMAPPSISKGGLSSSDGEPVTHVEVKLVHTFRLDEKWETFCANVTAKTLQLSEALLEPCKVLIYAAAASLVLAATARIIEAMTTTRSTTSADVGDDDREKRSTN